SRRFRALLHGGDHCAASGDDELARLDDARALALEEAAANDDAAATDDLAVEECSGFPNHELGVGADRDRATLEAALDLDARVVGKLDDRITNDVTGAEIVLARAARALLRRRSARQKIRNFAVGNALRAVPGEAGVEPLGLDFLDHDAGAG